MRRNIMEMRITQEDPAIMPVPHLPLIYEPKDALKSAYSENTFQAQPLRWRIRERERKSEPCGTLKLIYLRAAESAES